MKTLFCIAAVCMISTLGFGGDEDLFMIPPMCPPNCVKQPPMKLKITKVANEKLKR